MAFRTLTVTSFQGIVFFFFYFHENHPVTTQLMSFSPLQSSGYGMKEGGAGDVSMYGSGLGASPAGYYPYDPTFAAYG